MLNVFIESINNMLTTVCFSCVGTSMLTLLNKLCLESYCTDNNIMILHKEELLGDTCARVSLASSWLDHVVRIYDEKSALLI